MNKDLALTGGGRAWAVGPHVPQPGGGSRETRPQQLDLMTFLRAIQHWRWLVFASVLTGIALAILWTLTTTPLYRTTVTLEVNPPTVQIMANDSANGATAVSAYEFVATQVGLLRSRNVAERAAQELNLASNPDFVDPSASPAARLSQATSIIESRLAVSDPGDAQLIEFSYVSESPQLAARIANAIAESFINSSLQRRYEASAYARKFLERQIARTRASLEKSERELVAYAQQQGIINTGGGGEGQPSGDATSLQGQSLVALNQALAEATARRVAAEGAYRSAQSTGMTSEVSGSTQALRQARAAVEAEYQEKRTLMKPDHPEMTSLRSRIQELDRQIARETANVSNSRSNSLLAEYRAAQSAESALQSRVAQLRGSVLDLRGRSIRYTILQREVDTNRALYDALLQRFKEIGVAGGIGATPVSIVDRAEVPNSPYTPNLPLNLAIGLLLGLGLGVFAAIVLDFLNDTIKTRSDVREKLGLACLGTIPKRPAKEDFLEGLRDPGSPVSEAYSNVVASLRFSTERGVPKAILVASARPAEGKSSTALALSQNFARRGCSVLLIDCDLRKPAFKASTDSKGVSKVLTSDDNIADHVVPTQFENLSLLPSGPLPPNPADLLSTSRFKAVIDDATARYDVVVVDAPPVLGLADTALLATVVKDVMIVIESGKTRTSAAQECAARLRSAGAHLLGAMLSKVTEEEASYGYGYGDRYGKNRYGAIGRKPREMMLLSKQDDE